MQYRIRKLQRGMWNADEAQDLDINTNTSMWIKDGGPWNEKLGYVQLGMFKAREEYDSFARLKMWQFATNGMRHLQPTEPLKGSLQKWVVQHCSRDVHARREQCISGWVRHVRVRATSRFTWRASISSTFYLHNTENKDAFGIFSHNILTAKPYSSRSISFNG